MDRQFRSTKSKLTQRLARYAALTLHPEAQIPEIEKWEKNKAQLHEQIEQYENELLGLEEQRQAIPKHLEWDNLPEKEKFDRLAPGRKRLVDTVKLVAYRTETALAMIVRKHLAHSDEARALIRDLFQSDADLYPDDTSKILKVHTHTRANPRSNQAIQHLLNHLNDAEFVYPGTNLRLYYTLAGTPNQLEKVPP